MTNSAEETLDSYEAYATATAEPRFTDWLRERSEPAWTDATSHRVTQELGAGTLDEGVLRRYLIQDYAFVDTLVGVFGHAVGQAPSMAAKRRLIEFLDLLTDEENDYFERSFGALDVPVEERTDPELTETTEAMTDLLTAAAHQGGYAETLAVLVPAEWIYLTWATAESGDRPEAFYFAEWIDLHANPWIRLVCQLAPRAAGHSWADASGPPAAARGTAVRPNRRSRSRLLRGGLRERITKSPTVFRH